MTFEASSPVLIIMQVSRMWMYSRAYLQTQLNIKGKLSGGMSQKPKGKKSLVHPGEQFPNTRWYHIHLYKQA